jgi:heme exporter protein B
VPLVLLCMFLFRVDFLGKARGDVLLERVARLEAPTHEGAFLALLVLGTLALSLVGTLFGALTVRTRARDLVLAIVLFPLLSPVLVCGVVGTRKAFEAQPIDSYSGFVGLMGMSAAIALALGIGLFGALVDD